MLKMLTEKSGNKLSSQVRCEIALMETRDLCYQSQRQDLLQNISLKIERGTRTIILGSNGAGKSLLLRLLHGLIAPSSGSIFWHGKPLNKEAKSKQAMVFQRPVLLRRSVKANLKFALKVRQVPRKLHAAKIETALHDAGLLHVAKKPARFLSGGEQQRLAIVRALICEPEMLLMDEPTASLDPASTAAVEDLVLRASSQGVTVIWVTHNTGQALRLGQNLVFLQNGRVAEQGPLQNVLEHPQSEALRAWKDGRIYLGD